MVTNIAVVENNDGNDAIEEQTTTEPQMVILAIKKTRLHAREMFKSNVMHFPFIFEQSSATASFMTTCYKSHIFCMKSKVIFITPSCYFLTNYLW